ncbi:MAG: hypothetical protein GW875_03185 [Deltaproteobacteria bacterium]|nr:hypothetical protein [Deltaproteobacteria bacterium]NCP01803.1 hypothetical protein [Deltaproteobacteria bacterium]
MFKRFFIPQILVILALLLAGVPAISALADEVFVQSQRASILTAPRFGAPALVDVRQGERLVSEGKEKGWYKVSYANQHGWIFGFLVGPQAPEGVVSLLDKADTQQFAEGARRRASGFTTAAAARGLQDDRRRVSQKYQLDYDGVEWMEQISIRSEDALIFMTNQEEAH